MMVARDICKGRYRARLSRDPGDIARAQALRGLAFKGTAARPDADALDAICTHVLIETTLDKKLVGCFRTRWFETGQALSQSYSAQFYDLAALGGFDAPMIELGRFCIHPDWHDPDILRLAWGALTAEVETHGAQFLFGCASFHGTDAGFYAEAFAWLHAHHLAPDRWRPGRKAASVVPFAHAPARSPDPMRAMRAMPPLLRSYLGMGGWVSDHAVIDPDMNTLHVFTGLEIAAIPDARKSRLRAIAR